MIQIRVDVDYPYESRAKSFLWIALRRKSKNGETYLKNARIIARMINESPQQVKAYWFFTPYTVPDKKLLALLDNKRHEVGLHVILNPAEEWKNLEKETERKVEYYTIHGTQGRVARLLWRNGHQQPQQVIADFPLTSLHLQQFPTISIDRERFLRGYETSVKHTQDYIKDNNILEIHPDWLFRVNKRGKRGPVYDLMKTILEVDKDLDSLRTKKRGLAKIVYDYQEYEKNINPTEEFLSKLKEHGFDVYTFLDRQWCCPINNPGEDWVLEDDNVGLLKISTFDAWWQDIGKKTRNMVRKAEKESVKIEVAEASDKLAEGIWRIYNETPIRQERAFHHYGEPLEVVRGNMYAAKNNTFIGAYLSEELVGFIQILYGEDIAIISNILSLQQHWDKALNNALLAKAVEVCAEKQQRWLMYGRIGNHPSLDRFKDNNGFKKVAIRRVYIPLTPKGRLAIRLGLHRDLKDALPEKIKDPLIPVTNWVSRTKIETKLKLKGLKAKA